MTHYKRIKSRDPASKYARVRDGHLLGYHQANLVHLGIRDNLADEAQLGRLSAVEALVEEHVIHHFVPDDPDGQAEADHSPGARTIVLLKSMRGDLQHFKDHPLTEARATSE